MKALSELILALPAHPARGAVATTRAAAEPAAATNLPLRTSNSTQARQQGSLGARDLDSPGLKYAPARQMGAFANVPPHTRVPPGFQHSPHTPPAPPPPPPARLQPPPLQHPLPVPAQHDRTMIETAGAGGEAQGQLAIQR
eukprot:1150862-Pelagomonas_calceolata.AAC.8